MQEPLELRPGQRLQTTHAARLGPLEALVVEEELRARGDARRVFGNLAHDPRAAGALRGQEDEVARRLRSLGDDRRRRGEEQKFVRFHCLIFTPLTDLRSFMSDHGDTEATNLKARSWSRAPSRLLKNLS